MGTENKHHDTGLGFSGSNFHGTTVINNYQKPIDAEIVSETRQRHLPGSVRRQAGGYPAGHTAKQAHWGTIAAFAGVLLIAAAVWFILAHGGDKESAFEMQAGSFVFSEEGHTFSVTGAVICRAPGIVEHIPAEYEGLPVVAVRRDAFRGCTVQCQLPSTVQLVDEFAFQNAELPDSFDLSGVTVIGEGAFANTTLSTTFHLNRSPNYIGSGAFWHDAATEGSGHQRLFTYPDPEEDFYARINERIFGSETALGAVRRVACNCPDNPLYSAG